METDPIVRYDAEFLRRFEQLREMTEGGDRQALHRWLIEHFGFIFTLFQFYAKQEVSGGVQAFAAADEETKTELMRPLSLRQYRMVERAFSIWTEEKDLVISSLWDFLHDNGRIYEKKVMSAAEVCACSLILEEVYRCL